MYSVTETDQPRELENLPQSSIGALCPTIIAREHEILLAYYLKNTPLGWDGTTIRVLSDTQADEPCALVTFRKPYAHMFGPPSDEAFSGHPLAGRGLRPNSVFEIIHSSWIKTLERMNSCHPQHNAQRFSKLSHYIFSFHDTTFECIAEAFDLTTHQGSVLSVLLNVCKNNHDN